MTQIQEHQKLAIEEESLNKRYNDLVGDWKVLFSQWYLIVWDSSHIMMNLIPVVGGKVSSRGTDKENIKHGVKDSQSKCLYTWICPAM